MLGFLALPKLEQLNLTGRLNLQTVTKSVLSQLKHLHITINDYDDDINYDDDSLSWTLSNCKNLEHFTFSILNDPFNCVDKVISGCDNLPLKSLTSMTPISNTALAKIFQQRFNKGKREALESLQRYGPPFSEKFVKLGEEYDSWMVNHIATKLHDFGPEVDQTGSNILQKIYGLLPYDIDLSNFENVLSDLHACHY